MSLRHFFQATAEIKWFCTLQTHIFARWWWTRPPRRVWSTQTPSPPSFTLVAWPQAVVTNIREEVFLLACQDELRILASSYRSVPTSLVFLNARPKNDWLYEKCSLNGHNFASRSIWIAPPWLVAWVISTCTIASNWSVLKALLGGGGGQEWSKPAFSFKYGNGRT